MGQGTKPNDIMFKKIHLTRKETDQKLENNILFSENQSSTPCVLQTPLNKGGTSCQQHFIPDLSLD